MPLDLLITSENVESVAPRLEKADLGFVVYGDPLLAAPYFNEGEREYVTSNHSAAILPIGRVRGLVDGQILAMFRSPSEMTGGPGGQLHEHLELCDRIGELIAKPGQQQYYKNGYAGQTPAYVFRTKTPTSPMYLDGLTGSLATCVISTYALLKDVLNMSLWEARIGVYGLGTIGGEVHTLLARAGARLPIGYNPRRRGSVGRERIREGRVFTGDLAFLANCDYILNAAPTGDDILPAVEYFKQGVLVACETHPRGRRTTMQAIIEKGLLYMVGVRWPGIYIEPAFPGRLSEEIAGCLLETIASVLLGIQTRDVFDFIRLVTGQSVGVEYLPQQVMPNNISFYGLTF